MKVTGEIALEWEWDGARHRVPVSEERPVVIGRKTDCDVVLPLVIVSRRHARVFAADGEFFVENLSERNPVRINDDTRLQHAQRQAIRPGDVIRVGMVAFRVVGEGGEAPQATDTGSPKIRCRNCGRVQDYDPARFCAWCGRALVGGDTTF
jgi:pSer/pThr/pTyr-binding forkhead associated (FHA) protein